MYHSVLIYTKPFIFTDSYSYSMLFTDLYCRKGKREGSLNLSVRIVDEVVEVSEFSCRPPYVMFSFCSDCCTPPI